MPSGRTRRASGPAGRRWSPSTPWQTRRRPSSCSPQEYGQIFELCEGVEVRFCDAGHLLGSSMVEIWATENGVTKKLVFSGDLGNVDQPIIRDPVFVTEADYVVMESTYGDRNHEPPESYTEALAALIDDVFSKVATLSSPPLPWAAPRSCSTSCGRSKRGPGQDRPQLPGSAWTPPGR